MLALNPFAAFVRDASRAGVPLDLLARAQVSVVSDGARVHAPSGSCAPSFPASAAGSASVLDLAGEDLCPLCVGRLAYQHLPSRGHRPVYALVSEFVAGTVTARSAARLLARPDQGAPGRLERTRSALSGAAALASARADLGVAPGLEDLEAALRSELDRLRAALAALSRTDAHRSRLLLRLEADLVPEHLRGRVSLDHADSLCMLLSYHPGVPSLDEVVEAFTVRTCGSDRALFAPRFVLDWLLWSAGSAKRSPVVLPVPGAVSAGEVEVATGLWDPSGDGPLADLGAALLAARSLEDA